MEQKRIINKTRSAVVLAVVSFLAAGASASQLQTTVNNISIDVSRRAGGPCPQVAQILSTAPNAVCALSGVAGAFQGQDEFGSVGLESGAWVFRGQSCQTSLHFNVSCFQST